MRHTAPMRLHISALVSLTPSTPQWLPKCSPAKSRGKWRSIQARVTSSRKSCREVTRCSSKRVARAPSASTAPASGSAVANSSLSKNCRIFCVDSSSVPPYTDENL
eukprot:Amastigsp_a179851_17.p4 type:complete len:106 gc:universal Amastigsp_a179851_17:149-466(+)